MVGGVLPDLLEDLYAGVLSAERFGSFMSKASLAIGGHLAAFTVRSNVSSTPLQAVGERADARNSGRYQSDYGAAADNVWYLRSKPHMRTGSVIVSSDWATTPEVKKTRYYAEFLRDIDTMHSVAVCAQQTAARSVVLTFCRSEGQGEFEKDRVELLDALAPHIVNAYALTSERQALLSSSAAGCAVFELDENLRWLRANAEAEAVLSMRWMTGNIHKRIEPTTLQSRAQWQEHCALVQSNASAHLPPVPLFGVDGRLVALAVLRQVGMFCADQATKYICIVRPLASTATVDPTMMAGMFKLTPAEARLACAFHGARDLTTAATALGLSPKGAKTRMQGVMAKVGVGRQSELLALLDSLSQMA